MAWIESHTVLSRHRKVKETARALRIRPAYLIGHLHLLWHAALEQAEDGDLTRWSDEFIAESADFPGDAPQFVQLLQDHRWLDGRLLHDWLDCAGKYLIGKYAKDNRDRLVSIWAKHGKVYGKKPKSSPTDSQLESNQLPRTLLGEVGEVLKGKEEGGPGEEERGELRAAVVSAFRLNPVTHEERERLEAALDTLLAKGAKPADIPERIARYRKAWPNAADTLPAVLRWWDRFAPPAPKAARESAKDREVRAKMEAEEAAWLALDAAEQERRINSAQAELDARLR